MKLTDNALTIMRERYLQPGEEPEQLFWRVAGAVAKGEGSDKWTRLSWTHKFYSLLTSLRFLPNSPTLVNAGTGKGCLSACFVISPEDTMDSIMQIASDAAMIEKWGGGVGFGLSKIRPKGDTISTTQREACGPVKVMQLYSQVGRTLTQGAFREGAHMGQLKVNHPDILDFIHSKQGGGLENFNISVQLTDEFMTSLRENAPYPLVNPHTAEVEKEISPRTLWDSICYMAWKTGDPGVVFIDRVFETQPNPHMGDIQSSNPCGEEFLENYGNCCLGSINLVQHLYTRWIGYLEGFPDNQESELAIDWDALAKTTRLAVRFLDDVIDVNTFPLDKLREVNLQTRRIGLGVMGWADILVELGLDYDSEEAVELAETVSRFIESEAWCASHELAVERGEFPGYSKSPFYNTMSNPVRHSSVTTIAPTGTISRIAGVSSGIEPHFAHSYTSNVLVHGDEYATLKDSAPTAAKTAHEISPEWHVRMQAAWQKGVTNSVSKTINLPNSATAEDVGDAFWLAWELGCKAVTVYRDGSLSHQVLEEDVPKETKPTTAAEERPEPLVAWRPRKLTGTTTKIPTGHGSLYVTLNEHDSKLIEVFLTVGKVGECVPAFTEAMGRLASVALQHGVTPAELAKQLEGIACSHQAWYEGEHVLSVPDGVGKALRQAVEGELSSMPVIVTGVGNFCPVDGGAMIHQEGCEVCERCGHSVC